MSEEHWTNRVYTESEKRNMSTLQISKSISWEAKRLAKNYGVKLSVRKEEYAGGRKIYITVVKNIPSKRMQHITYMNKEWIWNPSHLCPEYHAWFKANPHAPGCEYPNPHGYPPQYTHLSAWAQELLGKLQAITDKYNYDNSDTMTDYFDVNFYTSIGFCPKLTAAARDELDAALKASEAEAPVAAPYIVKPESDVVDVCICNPDDIATLDALEVELDELKAERAALELKLVIASKQKQIAEERAAVENLRSLLAYAQSQSEVS